MVTFAQNPVIAYCGDELNAEIEQLFGVLYIQSGSTAVDTVINAGSDGSFYCLPHFGMLKFSGVAKTLRKVRRTDKQNIDALYRRDGLDAFNRLNILNLYHQESFLVGKFNVVSQGDHAHGGVRIGAVNTPAS